MDRPFYTQFAWAYDYVIEPPVSSRVDFIEEALLERDILAGSRLLDAGCGTGNYSIALARRGYKVTGVDASAELVSVARKKAGLISPSPLFLVEDILALSLPTKFDGIVCRGVLNDITDDASRKEVFRVFGRALDKGGVLILDVREWNATAARKREEPVFEKSVETERGRLVFRSVTKVDEKSQRLVISERHILERDGAGTLFEYTFVMRCWTKEELHNSLCSAGFGQISYFEGYDSNKATRPKDRIVAVASYLSRG